MSKAILDEAREITAVWNYFSKKNQVEQLFGLLKRIWKGRNNFFDQNIILSYFFTFILIDYRTNLNKIRFFIIIINKNSPTERANITSIRTNCFSLFKRKQNILFVYCQVSETNVAYIAWTKRQTMDGQKRRNWRR